jgi:hypothetical protein
VVSVGRTRRYWKGQDPCVGAAIDAQLASTCGDFDE